MTFVFPNKPIRVYHPEQLLKTLPPEGWVCQPKMDGKRVHPYIDLDGKVTLFGRLGQKFKELNPALAGIDLPRPWLGDGELLRDGRIFLWDYAILGGEKMYHRPYHERLTQLQSVAMMGATLVETRPAKEYLEILKPGPSDGLEGCVFKNLNATNLWGVTSTSEVNSQFKYRFK